MQSSDMKNMVVLKNLPSNMVEEAIIIFKEKQKVKQRELADKKQQIQFTECQEKSKEYILKEAEMLVTDYIKKIENQKKSEIIKKDIKGNYKILKYYSIISTIFLIISLTINFI